MPAFLLLLKPFLASLKPFWKYIAGAIVILSLVWEGIHTYHKIVDAAYQHGVADTIAADKAVADAQQKLNDDLVNELKLTAAEEQAILAGKLHESELVADDLRDKLRRTRVCTDSPSGSSGAVPGNPPTAPEVNGAAGSLRPFETVGDDLVGLAQSCKNTGDKLTTLQGYVTELLARFKQAEAAYHAAVPITKSTR